MPRKAARRRMLPVSADEEEDGVQAVRLLSLRHCQEGLLEVKGDCDVRVWEKPFAEHSPC